MIQARTFDEWQDCGFRVERGEKATGRCPKTNKPTFTEDQVREIYDDLDIYDFCD